MYPEDLRYSKDHEWVRLEGARATVGITHYAQKQLGDVVFVDLPEVGRVLAEHDTFGTVESVKAVSELYSPVAGTVTEVNPGIAQAPEKINTDPYGEAWMVRLEMADPSSVAKLMDAAAYRAFVESMSK